MVIWTGKWGGKGEMGLRLFPINDSTITSRSTTNILREFAFFYTSCVKATATARAPLKPRDRVSAELSFLQSSGPELGFLFTVPACVLRPFQSWVCILQTGAPTSPLFSLLSFFFFFETFPVNRHQASPRPIRSCALSSLTPFDPSFLGFCRGLPRCFH